MFCILYYVFCIMHYVFCIMCSVFCTTCTVFRVPCSVLGVLCFACDGASRVHKLEPIITGVVHYSKHYLSHNLLIWYTQVMWTKAVLAINWTESFDLLKSSWDFIRLRKLGLVCYLRGKSNGIIIYENEWFLLGIILIIVRITINILLRWKILHFLFYKKMKSFHS